MQHENSIFNNWRFEDVWLDKSKSMAPLDTPSRADTAAGCIADVVPALFPDRQLSGVVSPSRGLGRDGEP